MLEAFSIADAYLTTVLDWTLATAIDLSAWPAVQAYHQRLVGRPSIARAVAEEMALYRQAHRPAAGGVR